MALLFIAIPFAVVRAPFNMFVSDKSLKRLGAVARAVRKGNIVQPFWSVKSSVGRTA